MKRSLLKTLISASALFSCLPSYAAPLKYLTDKQIQSISVLQAYVICNARNNRQTFPGISDVGQSLLKAFQLNGVSANNDVIANSHLDSIEKNVKKVVDSLDPYSCKQRYQVSYEAPYDPKRNAYTAPPRQVGNIRRCESYLANKYGIYTVGQLQNCVSNASINDFMNNVPLTTP
jgi:hypothetical protein